MKLQLLKTPFISGGIKFVLTATESKQIAEAFNDNKIVRVLQNIEAKISEAAYSGLFNITHNIGDNLTVS